MNNIKTIKAKVELKEAMGFYGVEFNRKGFAKCPFHEEKTGSLGIKNNRYKCFGCNAEGDIIDFVENYFGLDFNSAVAKIDKDFGLGLKKKLSPKEKRKLKKQIWIDKKVRQAIKKHKLQQRSRHLMMCKVFRLIFKESIKNPQSKTLKSISTSIEKWLDDDLEERQRETWRM